MSPFEIRLELLKMSKDVLQEEYCRQCDVINMNWNISVEQANKQMQTPIPHPGFPPHISEQQIIDMAQRLNSFVSSSTPIESMQKLKTKS